MTGEALRVIKDRPRLQLLMRVMTGDAAQSWIILVVPRAIKDPIGLKTYVIDPRLARHQHRLLKAGMARSAEGLRQVVRVQISGIKDLPVGQFVCLGRHNMFFARAMTGFTANAGN